MAAKKIRWAANRPDGSAILIDGVVADLDEETGVVSIDERTASVVKDIIERGPKTATMAIVPMADFAEEVHRMITQSPSRRMTNGLTNTVAEQNPIEEATFPGEYQDVIDRVLRQVYSQLYHFGRLILGKDSPSTSLQELRNGPLGADLTLIARIANGDVEWTSAEVLGQVDSILETLFWPPGQDAYSVPREFWEEPLGEMLSTAILQTLDETDLLSIGAAAVLLGVTRPLIYRWIDEQVFHAVRDPKTGRILILKKDVDHLRDEMERYSRDLSELNEDEARIMPNVLVLKEPQRHKERASEEEIRSLFG